MIYISTLKYSNNEHFMNRLVNNEMTPQFVLYFKHMGQHHG